MTAAPKRPTPDCAAAAHELSERLTAVTNYLTVLDNRCTRGADADPPAPAEILDKALAQATQAGVAMRQLRALLDGPPADKRRGRAYRVSFVNEIANAGGLFRPRQRSLVVHSAHSRKQAVEIAKKRFARLEGVADWRIRAGAIEVERIEELAVAEGEPDKPLHHGRR